MADFQPFHILTPSPILGYGYDLDEFWTTVRRTPPAAIILDAGSTDPGPYMLGTDKTLCSRQSYTRDLEPILEACSRYGIKFLVSSAGGAGTNTQVDLLVDIIRSIAEQKQYQFKLATIKFNYNHEAAISKLKAGKMHSCGSSPPLQSTVDIIVAGRSYDPSPFAAFCMHRGVQESCAWHVGKIIECGGLCTIPKGRSILATLFSDCFVLAPTNPEQKCTPVSVAAHILYEKSRPDRLPGPGGTLYLDGCTYTQLSDGRSLLVKGSHFVQSPEYQIKLEGVLAVGFRSIFIGGIRDPILIAGIDEFLVTVKKSLKDAFPTLDTEKGPRIIFHLYGKNAVMGAMESEATVTHKIGILGEAVAASQDLADAIAGSSRTMVLHGSYKGQLATAGNMASPLTPLDTSIGPVFKFSVYHLMDIDDPRSLFPLQYMHIGANRQGFQQIRKSLDSSPVSIPYPIYFAKDMPVLSISGRHRTPLALKDIARVVRSKNSGPFEITLDILFGSNSDFCHVRDSNVLTTEVMKQLYQIKSLDDIVTCMFYEQALAWKCTFKRYQAQGSIGERDTFGAQMHAPLLKIVVPATVNVATHLDGP
ncbi:hypothetical protein EDB80DRAFT_755455 [Ilyonectria destructans]|nr:hypothetical protein EDB80DRAFT_755455 [Ilyonectria destructans]